MTERQLRWYQAEAVSAVTAQWGGGVRRTAVVLPTGAGKSTVAGALGVTAHRMGLSVVMLAQRRELLHQLADAVAAVDPTLPPVGIVAAERNEVDAPIVAASLATLSRPGRLEALGRRSVVIFDEVHHVSADTYTRTIAALGVFDPGTWFCGLTATLRREDDRELGAVIESVAYEQSLPWAVKLGILVPPRGLTVRLPDLDLSGVRTQGRDGDFRPGELAEVMRASSGTTVDAILTHARERRSIVFTASQDLAHELADDLTAAGYPSAAVTADTGHTERQVLFSRFRTGDLSALVTVTLLTEGMDFPQCDCVVIARPTRSRVLYSQMVGRAVRTHPGKTDALVLDLTGIARVLGLVSVTDIDPDAESVVVDTDGTVIEEQDEPGDDDGVGATAVPPRERWGPVDVEDFDVLAAVNEGAIHGVWLTTRAGIPFVCASQGVRGEPVILFAMPLPDGTYRPGWRWERMAGGAWLGEEDGAALDLVSAYMVCEQFAEENRWTVQTAVAKWRQNHPPSEGQLRFAGGLGIADAHMMTKARLSDEISVRVVSRVLDRYAPGVRLPI